MLKSLRSRFILLVVLAILPGVLLVLLIANEQRTRAIEQVRRTNISILRLVQANQSQLMTSAENLLLTLSQDRLVTDMNGDVETCRQVLDNILQRALSFRGFAVIKPDGEIWCSAPAGQPGQNVAGTEVFQRAMAKKGFVIGGFQVGSITGRGNLTFGYPLLDDAGHVSAVLYAGLSTDWMNQQVAQLDLPGNYVVDILDRDGTFVVRWPTPDEFVGTTPADKAITAAILTRGRDGQEQIEELEGVEGGIRRLYAFGSLPQAPDNDLFVNVGISMDEVMAQINQNLLRNLAALALAAFAGVALAWVASDIMLTSRTRALAKAAREWSAGDLAVRTGLTASPDEIGQLASSFDEMAASLQQRTRELSASEQRQRILAEVGEIFSSSLDFSHRLDQFTGLVLARMADWCAVNVLDDQRNLLQLTLAHRDEAMRPLVRELYEHYPPNGSYASVIEYMEKAQQSVFLPQFGEMVAAAQPQDARHAELMRQVELNSLMIVPLVARGVIIGDVTFMRGSQSPAYTEADLELAEELARRAAIALDHSLLFQQSQQLNEHLDQRVALRTQQLETSNLSLIESQEQLRLLSSRQRELVEEERTRISREVHDVLGGAMTVLKMDLVALQKRLPPAELQKAPVTRQFDALFSQLDQTIQSVRNISRQLRPDVLDNFGLAAALEWHLKDMENRTGIRCIFDCEPEDVVLPNDVATEAYRIVQEALTNVVRHAGATEVQVRVRCDAAHLFLRVQDNGAGLRPEAQNGRRSLGMLNMRERALRMKGAFNVSSAPGQGVTVEVTLPLDERAPDSA
jgi:signal transduction histidine kinase/HAMP domain-containing protein